MSSEPFIGPADTKFRCAYDELEEVAKLLRENAELIDEASRDIDAKMSTLREGKKWVGKGADEFYAEMDQLIRPRLKRLGTAMTEGFILTWKISKIARQTEGECAREFARKWGQTLRGAASE